MAETTIVRSEIVVVDTVDSNSYGDMLFTDKAGKSYKVGNKRVQYFENVIIPGVAVELNYATAYKKEYIYNAVQVAIPKEVEPLEPEPQIDEPELGDIPLDYPMPLTPAFQVDGRTHDIHRQVSLKCAVELASHGIIKVSELKEHSEKLLRYLDGE